MKSITEYILEANRDKYQQHKYDDVSQSAIFDYAQGFTSNVNDDLRKGKIRGDKQVIADLDNAFKSKWAESEKLDVYRTIDWDYMKAIYNITKENIEEHVGKTFVNKGYMSTTNTFQSPWGKKWQDNELILHIVSEKEQVYIDINKCLKDDDEFDAKEQKEYLLPRDTKLELVSYKELSSKDDKQINKEGNYKLECKIV